MYMFVDRFDRNVCTTKYQYIQCCFSSLKEVAGLRLLQCRVPVMPLDTLRE